MSAYFRIHPQNPQPRLINQAVDIIRQGGVVVYPTDSCYAIGCGLGEKSAVERICRLRQLPDKHNFALLCRDLSELGSYANVDNLTFRTLKAATPGPFTFILKGSAQVPKLMMHPKRKTMGLRVPDNAIAQALLEELGQPLLTSTLQLPDSDEPEVDPEWIKERVAGQVDLIIDGGVGDSEPTTVIDLVEGDPQIIRQGKGDFSAFI